MFFESEKDRKNKNIHDKLLPIFSLLQYLFNFSLEIAVVPNSRAKTSIDSDSIERYS